MYNLSIAVTNILLLEELKNLLKSLKGISVSPIILKGAALAETVYPDISLRPIGDIDILVKEKDVKRVKISLSALGYLPQHSGELHFIKDDTLPVNIDVHSSIWYMPERGVRDLWHRAERICISGEPGLAMPYDEALIYTAAHTSVQHGSLSHTALEDINRISQFIISWDEVIRRVKEYNISVPVYYTFLKAKLEKEASIPQYVLANLRPSSLFHLFESALFQSILSAPPVPKIGHILIPFTQRGVSGKMRFLVSSVFPPLDFVKRRYNLPSTKVALIYRILRPFLLLSELSTVSTTWMKNVFSCQPGKIS